MLFRVGVSCRILSSIFSYYMLAVANQFPRLGKIELICLLSFTCNDVVSVRRGFLFPWALGTGCVSLLWHSLSLHNNYFKFLGEKSKFLGEIC